jgi:DNA-binding transcriptional regulator GbsR (MarR family)
LTPILDSVTLMMVFSELTEMTDQKSELSPAVRKFILHWGELGTRWGINRTVAQIHALLYISDAPLPADRIAELLSLARSNVSTSLRELQGWGIVRVVHKLGDRRDHFESLRDVWQLFQVVVDERKRREVDPTIAVLRDCAAELERAKPAEPVAHARIVEMQSFFESMASLYNEAQQAPLGALRQVIKLKGRLRRLWGA